MEDKFTPSDPFEEYVRKTLQAPPATSEAEGDALWAKIAAQQRPLNARWQRQFWLKQALWPSVAAVVVLGALGIWWKMGRQNPTSLLANAPTTREMLGEKPIAPTATIPERAGFSASLQNNAKAENRAFASLAQALPWLTLVGDERNLISPWAQEYLLLNGKDPYRDVASLSRGGSSATSVNAPVPSWIRQNAVPLQRAQFLAEEGIQYTSQQSGNTVIIPPDALVYNDGSPVRGEVSLYFRDYRSVADLFAGNIPMHYTDERGDFIFNTGGMFEVNVGKGEAKLKIAEGKGFQVQFQAIQKLQDANLYYFEPEAGAWTYLYQEAYNGGMTRNGGRAQPKIVSENQVVMDNARSAGGCTMTRIKVEDGRPLVSWLRDGIRAGLELAKDSRPVPQWLANYAYKGVADPAMLLARPGEVYVVQRRDGITRFFPQDKANVHTELAAFKDCHFVRVGDSLSRAVSVDSNGQPRNMEALLRRTKPWRTVFIDQVEGDRCRIVFTDEKDEGSAVLARLVQSNEVPNRKNFSAAKVFQQYQALRKQRAERWAQQVRDMTAFIRFAQMHQTEEEWCLPPEAWLKYFAENRTAMQARYTQLANGALMTDSLYAAKAVGDWLEGVKAQQAQRQQLTAEANRAVEGLSTVLSLNAFGLYNCDQIFRLSQKPEYVEAVYRNATGDRVWPTSVNIMDWDRRIFLPMPNAKYLIKQAGKRMDVVVRDNRGRIYHLPAAAYKTLEWRSSKEAAFTLTDVTDTAQSPQDWQRILGL